METAIPLLIRLYEKLSKNLDDYSAAVLAWENEGRELTRALNASNSQGLPADKAIEQHNARRPKRQVGRPRQSLPKHQIIVHTLLLELATQRAAQLSEKETEGFLDSLAQRLLS